MALHLGLHLHNTLSKWERQLKAQAAAKAWALRLLQASVLLGAVWCLQRNQVLSDLLMLPVRPIAFEPLRFYAEHLVIIGGFAVFTHGLLALLTPQRPAR